jgi:hypothetical protein
MDVIGQINKGAKEDSGVVTAPDCQDANRERDWSAEAVTLAW